MTFIDQTNSIKAIIKIGGIVFIINTILYLYLIILFQKKYFIQGNSKKKGGFLGFGAS